MDLQQRVRKSLTSRDYLLMTCIREWCSENPSFGPSMRDLITAAQQKQPQFPDSTSMVLNSLKRLEMAGLIQRDYGPDGRQVHRTIRPVGDRRFEGIFLVATDKFHTLPFSELREVVEELRLLAQRRLK